MEWTGSEIFQNDDFVNIYTKYRNLDKIKIQGNTAFLFKNPLLSTNMNKKINLFKRLCHPYLKMRVYLLECDDIDEFLNECIKYCKTSKIPILEVITSRTDAGLTRYTSKSVGTFIIDLKQDMESIWKSFKQQNRTQIRFAHKKGVSIRQANMDDLKEWWGIYLETASRGKFVKQRYEMVEELFKNTEISRLFVAAIDDKIAAGIFILTHHTPLYWIGGSLPEYWNLRPNNLIHWEIIKWAHSCGYAFYDMGGAVVNEEHGPTRFKEQFGGRYIENYRYRIDVNLWAAQVVDMMVKVRYGVRKGH
jgi:lipid II:glycine glycyltransferase (peptidoglycan interpeptide bridge formation enzyme)